MAVGAAQTAGHGFALRTASLSRASSREVAVGCADKETKFSSSGNFVMHAFLAPWHLYATSATDAALHSAFRIRCIATKRARTPFRGRPGPAISDVAITPTGECWTMTWTQYRRAIGPLPGGTGTGLSVCAKSGSVRQTRRWPQRLDLSSELWKVGGAHSCEAWTAPERGSLCSCPSLSSTCTCRSCRPS